jgi:hypothetical protein
LWQKLIDLEQEKDLSGYCWNTLTKTYISKKEKQFYWEDQQITIFDLLEETQEEVTE